MDIKQIKFIIQFISKLNINEVKIQIENVKIYVKKNNDNKDYNLISSLYKKSNNNYENFSDLKNIKKRNSDNYKNKNYLTIKSPMIGIFYRKPNPDEKPFVEIGDKIEIGMKVCVIEAMKLFNDIESEISGKLVKVLVKNATPVDYDQPLFLLESDN